MEKRVTIKDVARAAGVHYSTVSRALRADPQVSPERIEEIRAIARRLGYTPDPMLRALAHYRISKKPVNFKETIAFLWPDQTRSEVNGSAYLLRYLQGARSRAGVLGFELDEFFLREGSAKSLARVLHARGIRGLIIGGFNRVSTAHLRLPFEGLATAAIGEALIRPRLHRVGHDHYRAMRIALHNLKRMRYRKIGLLIDGVTNRALESRYVMSFLAHHPEGQERAQKLIAVPDRITEKAVAQFVRKVRPEVLVMSFSLNPEVGGVAFSDGPFPLPVVSLDVIPGEGEFAGIDQQSTFIASNAVDIVAEQILHGHAGIPRMQKIVLSEGVWTAGSSCPPRGFVVAGIKLPKKAGRNYPNPGD